MHGIRVAQAMDSVTVTTRVSGEDQPRAEGGRVVPVANDRHHGPARHGMGCRGYGAAPEGKRTAYGPGWDCCTVLDSL